MAKVLLARSAWSIALVSLLLLATSGEAAAGSGPRPGSVIVLPDDGRELYFQAIDSAKREIRILICVLEDPQILQHLGAALERGVRVRAIVDRGKYDELPAERANLAQYLSATGGELHLSNPIFPRSFPKIILVDANVIVYGSGCLDQLTFLEYRDFAHVTTDQQALRDIQRVFENDWAYSAPVGAIPRRSTPPLESPAARRSSRPSTGRSGSCVSTRTRGAPWTSTPSCWAIPPSRASWSRRCAAGCGCASSHR